ncbi:hypothetical protein LN042_23980 [Kitasatospora sp. RB6PN24]|uniref:hypothetical protein n=1 Tax=Kitasatospora humi TaxID=2893891 RepID=UPI001E3ADD57|nr:hypothetical protein [Kitasatospora humi]MCC9310089.1 hypothetical protein [Kitasatospora humi]
MTQLPDIFETRQGHALRDAYTAGDMQKARQIEEHLLAEAATTPAEREELADTLRSTVLFKEMYDARAAGDDERADSVMEHIKLMCTPKMIKMNLAAGYMQAGMREGLTKEQHDQLKGWINDLGYGPEIQAMVESIQVH